MSDKKCCSGCPLTMAAKVLVLVGALNWGLVGAFGFDLVATLLGAGSMLSRIVYVLVGLAAVFMIAQMAMNCKGGSCSMGDKK